ncbi:MAG: DUF2309 domain-containing protein [Acidimicrobiales bacterium]|nr:DUF2309 domain-containing protein [Acidimicrobiales bacterium]
MSGARAVARGRLRVELARAARIVAPLWPLERAVAVNPMHGLVEWGFETALVEARRWHRAHPLPGAATARRAVAEGRLRRDDLIAALGAIDRELADGAPIESEGRRIGALEIVVADLLDGVGPELPRTGPRTTLERVDERCGTEAADLVDAEVGRWCTELVDTHRPASDRWREWCAYAPYDRRLRRLVGSSAARRLAELPEQADDAVLQALAALQVPAEHWVDELRGQLVRLPGWAGYSRWCDEWAAPDDPAPRLSMLELLAIRLTVDALFVAHLGGPVPWDGPPSVVHPAPSAARIDAVLGALGVDSADVDARRVVAEVLRRATDDVVGRAVLVALEATYRRDLLREISEVDAAEVEQPRAQVVFCIDVRSEGIRRHLEAIGPYETLGFAGFFGAAMRFREVGAAESTPLAPVLVRPEVEVAELDDQAVAPVGTGERFRRRDRAVAGLDELSHDPMGMYALAEVGGWALGPIAALSSLAPGRRPSSTRPPLGRVEIGEGPEGTGYSLDERALVAESALRTMGLTRCFAPLVVLCGHGATTTANAHGAMLQCGACGGNRGRDSARVMAAILNDRAVRERLAETGIEVPDSTWFVAAEHDTTTDEICVFASSVPASHRGLLGEVSADLAEAGRRHAADRVRTLPGTSASVTDPVVHARTRARDWAQARPEWGLANNAAMIIGPRSLTRGVNLRGRVFLHSYDPADDRDGAVLETILTAPLVVAQWINMGYYGSAVEPRRWGAGEKPLHNPVPGVGVLEGDGTDLRPGLPWQSVADELGLRHEPIRLLALVVAPVDRVEAIIARNDVLQHLFDGAWVHLAVVSPDLQRPLAWQRRLPGGRWTGVGTEIDPALVYSVS